MKLYRKLITKKKRISNQYKLFLVKMLMLFFIGFCLIIYATPTIENIEENTLIKPINDISLELSEPETIVLKCSIPVIENIQVINSPEIENTTIQWGGGVHGIGMMGYNPGACNGLSGGAIPTQVKMLNDGSFWIADGYGPRLVLYTKDGFIKKYISLNQLRRDELKELNALCGFTFQIDNDGTIYVLDTRKKTIYYYNSQGEYYGCIDLHYVFENPSTLLEVQPLFSILDGPLFSIVVTQKNEKQELNKGFGNVPITPSEMKGLIINKTARIISSFNPTKTKMYWNSLVKTEMLQPKETKNENANTSFILKQTFYGDGGKIISADVIEPNWQGGGIIGTDSLNRIYYWVNSEIVGILDPLLNQTPKMQVKYLRIPKCHMHPVGVIPTGGIFGLSLKKDDIHVIKVFENSP
ncbi:MAG: hypothetical protein KAH01_07505 [Caldisericia bacterium]|nr:hypothetical protein [Caldisericia bacterium]